MSNPFEQSGSKAKKDAFKTASSSAHPITPSPLVTKKATKGQDVGEEKKGFFSRLFGRDGTGAKKGKGKKGATARAKAEEAEMAAKQHEELLSSVNEISKALEKSQAQQVEVSVKEMVTPIPVENIDALTKVQEDVSGALEKVAGRLDRAGDRDGKFIDSLTKMDGTLSSLSRASEQSLELTERSISSLDGVKGAMGSVSNSMETMQSELVQSGKRYQDLCQKVQETEKVHAETLVTLQKRTLWVMVGLGVLLVGSLVVVVVLLQR